MAAAGGNSLETAKKVANSAVEFDKAGKAAQAAEAYALAANLINAGESALSMLVAIARLAALERRRRLTWEHPAPALTARAGC